MVLDENCFELNNLSFIVFHLIFILYFLWPYFPLLLETSKVVEHLTSIKLNLDYIEKEYINPIVDTNMKGTR